jgi:hypothetical protein
MSCTGDGTILFVNEHNDFNKKRAVTVAYISNVPITPVGKPPYLSMFIFLKLDNCWILSLAGMCYEI